MQFLCFIIVGCQILDFEISQLVINSNQKNFDVLLTLHLKVILVINQLNVQLLLL